MSYFWLLYHTGDCEWCGENVRGPGSVHSLHVLRQLYGRLQLQRTRGSPGGLRRVPASQRVHTRDRSYPWANAVGWGVSERVPAAGPGPEATQGTAPCETVLCAREWAPCHLSGQWDLTTTSRTRNNAHIKILQ